ncbi:Catalase-related peroxidase [Fulvia fulva]|uniref:Catalase-related peroxidase n=1 Tax=Passalora fulva TaxID=5499 RepID=A0A9Q8P2Q5_PASFU|nr:Catalase-related peroxidase [Fulvia fulva]KAK4635749.1 Catalase-related peroxidase [Fulvia fulva]KAK4638682.1 Catalase-related peroxidase [Fulvia fulva]UJO11190.1 Catalase-related peroxidase [Fulvia fulva]WPV09122.1 Catalase-related peroxidase [Fulvia fulva]WPV23030.1 Catalase-related peroxidase [Fulvia fulva]
MPLPDNEKTVETANKLVKTLRGAFNTPSAYRPAHARGRLVKGAFEPSTRAAELSKAPHFHSSETPVVVRFSSATGLPNIPDTSGDANPRGMGIRFVLSDDGHRHTDIIAHSTAFFPVRTGEGFLELLGAIGGGTIGKFLEENPAAAAFVNDPKPSPTSFATEKYYAVNAFKLISGEGKETSIRYRVVPEEFSVLSESDLATKSESYLYEELPTRLAQGPVVFKLVAQIAQDGDVTDDATVHWPEERDIVELGTIELNEMVSEAESKKYEKHMILDPIPRVDGIGPSDDPLLDMQAAIYLLSGRERRAAEEA